MIARIDEKMSDVYASQFDKVIEWLLIALLAFMPFVFGAVEAWSEQVVITLAGAISICFLLKLIYEKHTRIIWSWAYVPLVLFITVVILQLIPPPGCVIDVLSPSTALMKKELLGDLVNSEDLFS